MECPPSCVIVVVYHYYRNGGSESLCVSGLLYQQKVTGSNLARVTFFLLGVTVCVCGHCSVPYMLTIMASGTVISITELTQFV